MKAARRRILPWFTGVHARAYKVRELAGSENWLFAPNSHNLLCNLESKPFFAIVPDDLRYIPDFGPRQPFGRRFPLRGIHPHVERRIVAKTETARALVDLRRRNADIEENPVHIAHTRLVCGGTDLASCFRSIVERMQGGDWYDADAVVISDFIAQRLPDDVVNKVKELQRVHQHRFHAVAMSAHGKPGIMRIFDHIWRFDTGLRSRLLRRWQR